MKNLFKSMGSYINKQKVGFFIIIALCVMGIILGILFATYMDQVAKSDMMEYVNSFFMTFGQKDIKYKVILIQSLKNNLLILLIILILAYFRFGFIASMMLVSFKSFLLSYCWCAILMSLGSKGIGVSILALAPQNIFFIPAFIMAGGYSIHQSFSKLKNNKHNKFYENNSINIVSITLFFIILGMTLEVYILPNILKFVVQKIF